MRCEIKQMSLLFVLFKWIVLSVPPGSDFNSQPNGKTWEVSWRQHESHT